MNQSKQTEQITKAKQLLNQHQSSFRMLEHPQKESKTSKLTHNQRKEL